MIRGCLFAILIALAPLVAQSTPFWGAKESRPPETAPADLKPGEFVWNPVAAQDGPILAQNTQTDFTVLTNDAPDK
jgi:hypothetical protein